MLAILKEMLAVVHYFPKLYHFTIIIHKSIHKSSVNFSRSLERIHKPSGACLLWGIKLFYKHPITHNILGLTPWTKLYRARSSCWGLDFLALVIAHSFDFHCHVTHCNGNDLFLIQIACCILWLCRILTTSVYACLCPSNSTICISLSLYVFSCWSKQRRSSISNPHCHIRWFEKEVKNVVFDLEWCS